MQIPTYTLSAPLHMQKGKDCGEAGLFFVFFFPK